MSTPIYYFPSFLATDATYVFDRLWADLDWVRAEGSNRREYYVARAGIGAYTYGRGAGRRTYEPQFAHILIRSVWNMVETMTGVKFDVCFLNGYENERDALGWHADDSPEMDDARPIAIVSLGAEREIMFRPKGTDQARQNLLRETLMLQNGSLCLMASGMQDTHEHKIPKAGRAVGPRISFTFRGYVKQ
jgi:hypothetical protein